MSDKIADQFTGLDMSALIGGPLKAACEAQTMMANATADFIEQVGLDDEKDGVRKVRTTAFSFTRTGPMQDGKATQEEITMNVPFLSIVNVPSLAITDVNVNFDMEVKSASTQESEKSKSGDMDANLKAKFGFFSADVKIKGSVSTNEKNTRSTDNSAKYHVEVKARDKGMPEGLAKMLDVLSTACEPTSIENKEVKSTSAA